MILKSKNNPDFMLNLQDFQLLEANRVKVNGRLMLEHDQDEKITNLEADDYFLLIDNVNISSLVENLVIFPEKDDLFYRWEGKILINYLKSQ